MADAKAPVDGKQGKRRSSSSPEAEEIGKVTVLDVLRGLGGLLLLNCVLSWSVTGDSLFWGWRPWFAQVKGIQAWMVSCGNFPLLTLLSGAGWVSGKGGYRFWLPIVLRGRVRAAAIWSVNLGEAGKSGVRNW